MTHPRPGRSHGQTSVSEDAEAQNQWSNVSGQRTRMPHFSLPLSSLCISGPRLGHLGGSTAGEVAALEQPSPVLSPHLHKSNPAFKPFHPRFPYTVVQIHPLSPLSPIRGLAEASHSSFCLGVDCPSSHTSLASFALLLSTLPSLAYWERVELLVLGSLRSRLGARQRQTTALT